MNETRQPKQALMIESVKDAFAMTAVAASQIGRTELATFCLLLAAIEDRGGLEAIISTLKPQLSDFLGDLEMRRLSSNEWPEAIELNED